MYRKGDHISRKYVTYTCLDVLLFVLITIKKVVTGKVRYIYAGLTVCI